MSNRHIQELFDRAREAGCNRNYQLAIELLQEILVHSDEMPVALLYLGRAYHATGDFNRAIQALQFYLKLEPDSAEGHFFLGRAYFTLGLLGHAFRHLKSSTRLDDSFVPALGLLGLTLLKRGHPQTAVAVFERALTIEPENQRIFTGYLNALLTDGIRLFRRGQYEEARDTLLFIRKHRPDSLVAHLYLASIYRELGDGELSLYHFEEAAHLAPKDPVLHLQKAILHLQRGNNPAAFEEMNQAMGLLGSDKISTQDVQSILRLMTIVLFQNQRHREALESARRVLRISYRDADMHAIMAESFSKLGELKKAKNHYLRALDTDRNRLEFNYGLAAVLWEREEFRELGSVLDRILRIHPQDEYAHYYRALSLPFLVEDVRQTIPALQEQIRRSGPDPHLMNALGQEYLRADLPDLAEGWFRRTVKRAADFQQALENLIEVYRRLEDKAKLLRAYADYLKAYPEDVQLRKEYTYSLYDQGNYTKACTQLEKILPYEPKNTEVRSMLAHSYRQTAKYPEAILLYRELLLETPKDLDLVKPLVFCLEASGNRETVILLLEKAVKLFREDPWLRYRLGSLYMAEGSLEKAAESFRSVIGLDPDDWQAHRSLAELYGKMGNNQFADRFRKRAKELKEAQERAAGEVGIAAAARSRKK
ncbi:MAG: tetratricopeptide repeat protein [Spirochaetaceae bacterium]|nr:MAG: tetratricopeptide repeat protein [Spirochaetaceae bacterium]